MSGVAGFIKKEAPSPPSQERGLLDRVPAGRSFPAGTLTHRTHWKTW